MNETAVLLALMLSAVACTLLSACYSGIETGIYCLNPVRLRVLCSRREPAALALHDLLRDRTHLLVVLLLGNNIVNYGATASLTLLLIFSGWSEQAAGAVTTLVLTPVLFVFGEMVPKTLFQRFADTLTYRWSTLILWSHRAMTWSGLASGVRLLTIAVLTLLRLRRADQPLLPPREQLRHLLIETALQGTLTRHQSELAANVLRVSHTTVAQIMVPIERVWSIPRSADFGQVRQLALTCPFSRLVVHAEGDRRDVLGALSILDALLLGEKQFRVDRCLLPLPSISPSQPVLQALQTLQASRHPMAAVVDRSGRALGIITLKDVVEEIVGELRAW